MSAVRPGARWILVAGPYTSGAATAAERARNLAALDAAALAVWRLGHVPLVGVRLALPLVGIAGSGAEAELLMPVSLAAAERCDAVLRIGGASRGADAEVEQVRARGGDVYTSLADVPAARAGEEGVHDAPAEGDLRQLEEEINRFNFATTGIHDGRSLAIFRRDADGALRAGLAGHTWGGTGKVRLLWVREAERHRGLGSELLAAAEREARARGCTQMLLSTHSFQAPGFYARHGYETVADVADYPRGHAQRTLRKRLDALGPGGEAR